MKKGACKMHAMWKAVAVAVVSFGLAGPAVAQKVRIQPYVVAPMKRPVVPPLLLIKPSQALNIALQTSPAAKALGVQLRGPLYIVKLKQGNKIIQVRVDAASGAVR